MKKVLLFLLLVNICCLALAFFVDIPLPFDQWRKGPPIHAASAYSSGNALRIFWVATAGFLDLYLLMIFLFHHIIMRKNILLKKWVYFSIILIILGSSFFIMEHAVRLFIKNSRYYTQFRPNPLLYWWNRPNLKDFRGPSDGMAKSTNSSGFRYKRDIPYKKAKDEYRIFVVGDSSTFGHGVEDKLTFASQLERLLLNKSNPKVRVINAACPGHTTYQNLILLKETLLRFHPDMVIVANNDDQALEYIEEKERAYRTPFIRKLNDILYRSDYYLLFQRVVTDLKIFLLTRLKMIPRPSLVRRVSLQDYENNIKEFIKTAAAHNIQLMFIKMPINRDVLDRFPKLKKVIYDGRYPEALSRICKEENQLLIDVDDSWQKKQEKELYEHFSYKGYRGQAPYHPSAKGHFKIAKQVFDTMLQKEIPPLSAGNRSETKKQYHSAEPPYLETSVRYFIMSDRQDAFDELQDGEVRNIYADNITIIFDIDTEGMENPGRFKDGDLVMIFYKNGAAPLQVSRIISVDEYGEAENESELLKMDRYIYGKFCKDKSGIEVLFDTKDHLTYTPTAVYAGDIVRVVYSQGIFKPPLARRIIREEKSGMNTYGVAKDKSTSPLPDKEIKDYFYNKWFKLGSKIWKKVAHCQSGSGVEYGSAKILFKTVANKVAADLGMAKDTVIKTVHKKEYIKR